MGGKFRIGNIHLIHLVRFFGKSEILACKWGKKDISTRPGFNQDSNRKMDLRLKQAHFGNWLASFGYDNRQAILKGKQQINAESMPVDGSQCFSWRILGKQDTLILLTKLTLHQWNSATLFFLSLLLIFYRQPFPHKQGTYFSMEKTLKEWHIDVRICKKTVHFEFLYN